MGNSDSNASLKTLYANYVSIKQLNDSRFGEGRIVRHKQTKEDHFQREINLTDEQQFKALKLYLEKKIANPHPNILNLLKTYYSEDQQFCGQFFKIYLLLEFCPTTLYDIIENRILKKIPFSEDELWTILIGAIEGFAKLEQSQVSHQAIRPDTISVRSDDLLVKVYDPTICNNITTYQILMTEDTYYYAYVSPQLMSSLRDETKLVHNPYKSDVYSLGVVMLHTASLQSCDDCYDYIKNKVLHQQVQKRISQIESQFSPQYIQILRAMLLLNEEQRPDFTQLKQEISDLISEPPKQTPKQQEEAVYEIRSPPPKPVYEEVGMYQSFKSPTVIVKEDLFPINKTEVSAKFIQPETNQLKQSLATPMIMQSGLRENLFRADKCDHIQHIKISEQPSNPSEHDNNIGNQIGAAEENEDFFEEQVHDNTDIIENLMPVTSIPGSSQKPNYSLNQYDIQPVSYDSYKIQREEYQPNRSQYQYETANAHYNSNNNNNNNNNINNNNSVLTLSNQQKYEYLYDQQLSNQQKLSQYQQDIKKNFEITTSIRKETVVEHYPNGSSYEGEKLNGLRHGQGCFYYQDNGGVYEGQWFENKMHGQGTLFYASGKPAYEGQWVNDKFEGKGTLYNEEPHILNGEYDYKDFDKIGEYWCKYSGQFHEDNKEGLGTLYISNGEYFEGYFLQDLVSGPGKYYKKNGQKQALWGNVFLYLNQKEIALSEQVCKFWYYLLNSDTYWLRKIFKVFYCESPAQFQWYKHKVKNLQLKELEFYECQIQLDSVQVQELLSYLDLELLSIKVNNQQYLDVIFKQMNNLSIFETYGNVNDEQLEILAKNNKLVELHLKNQKCQEYNKSLAFFKDLKCLSLLSYHQNFDYVREILVNSFNTLTELEIEAEQLDSSQMNVLLSSLNPEIMNKLCIYYFEQYNNSHIQQMSQFKRLQKLTLRQAKNISELSMNELVKDKSFVEIDLTQCEGIDDDVLQQIILNSPNLESIKLGWIYSLSDEIICLLFEKCSKLKEAILTGCKQLTEKCIPKQLSFLKNLRYLEFKSCNFIEDELLLQIKNKFRYIKIINYYDAEIE